MKIFFSSNGEKYDIEESGVMSMYYWENPDIEVVMNSLFKTRPTEKIEAIIINKDGIKAKFTRIPSKEQLGRDLVDRLL